LALITAALTVGYQSIKAGLTDPLKSLSMNKKDASARIPYPVQT
jgi:hypothetical protein